MRCKQRVTTPRHPPRGPGPTDRPLTAPEFADLVDAAAVNLHAAARGFSPEGEPTYLNSILTPLLTYLRRVLSDEPSLPFVIDAAPCPAAYTTADLRREFDKLRDALYAVVPLARALDATATARLERALGQALTATTERVLLTRPGTANRQRWIREAVNRLPNAIFFLSVDAQNIWFTNAAAKRMLGAGVDEEWDLERVTTTVTATTPDGKAIDQRDLPSRRTLRGEALKGEEIVLHTARGRFHLRAFSEHLPSSYGEARSAFLVLIDISGLRAREADVRHRESELRFTLASARMGTWSIDFTRNGVVTLSPEAQQILHCRSEYRDQTEGTGSVVYKDDVQHVRDALDATIADGRRYQSEYRFVTPTGELRWANSIARSIYDDVGRLVAISGIVMDVTERKRTEADSVRLARELTVAITEMSEAKQIAETANQSKSRFLANMSHEIRTPLGAIMGFASLLHDPALDSATRDTFVATIERNSTQLLRIIDDILDLSKVEAGRVQIERIEFSLGQLLADFGATISLRAREKAVEFTTTFVTPVPERVIGDPTRLRQILTNVVGNAIKFTDHGRVDLRVSHADDKLYFAVEDSGRGIPEDLRVNLFQPFTQADGSITRKYGGTGLGLVLTRGLAQALGGDFELKESHPDRGSTFAGHVTLPAAPGARMIDHPAAAPSRAAVGIDRGELAGMNLLLVEDSPDNQALITIYLERAGARLDLASDGAEGYARARAGKYHAVLMDVQMPVMDGVTAVQNLRRDGYQGPIVALTAHAMKEERARCLAAGYTAFLSKPITRERLITVLEAWRPGPDL